MSCDCKGCQRGKQISTIRQLQPDEAHLSKHSKYPTKSKKIVMDRYKAARESLLRSIEWYIKYKDEPRGHFKRWNRLQRSGWSATKYRKARAEAKKHGLL